MNFENLFYYTKDPKNISILPLRIQRLNFLINKKNILKNINIDFIDNSISVIMGPNGSGKTILLKIINGLLKPSSGEIIYKDSDLKFNQRIFQSFVFQKPVIFRSSVKENLKFIFTLKKSNYRLSLKNYLEIVGLESLINSPARKLSLGEQQRLSVIRAFANEPSFILFDEPTSNLDPHSTLVIEKIILAAKKFGIKIIFVTHDIFQAKRLADEIIFMDKGEIIEISKAKNFFDKPSSSQAQKYISGEILN